MLTNFQNSKMKYLYFTFFISFFVFSCQGQEKETTCEEKIKWAKKNTRQETKAQIIDSLRSIIREIHRELKGDTVEKVSKIEKVSKKEVLLDQNIKSLIKNTSSFAWRLTFKGKSYDTYIVNTKQHVIRLFNKNKRKGIHNFETILEQVKKNKSRLAFLMNAGMYQPDKSPQGLYIENGKVLNKLNTITKAKGKGNFFNFEHNPKHKYGNGVFLIGKNKTAAIVPTDDYAKTVKESDVLLATQSGPIALYQGKINQYFKEKSKNTNIRNGVGIINKNKIVFLISNQKVNLYEFGEVFREVFGCQDALYLDGAISRHYTPDLKRVNTQSSNHLGTFIAVIK